jgi:hypothetical protein
VTAATKFSLHLISSKKQNRGKNQRKIPKSQINYTIFPNFWELRRGSQQVIQGGSKQALDTMLKFREKHKITARVSIILE